MRLDKTEAKEISESYENFVIGKMRLFLNGSDLTFIVAGGILKEVLEASNLLSKNDIKSRILSCHSVKPIDKESILNAASETNVIITVEENNICGGFGSAVAEVLMDNNIFPKKFLRLAIPDVYSSIVGDQYFLRNYYGISSKKIFKRVLNLIQS